MVFIRYIYFTKPAEVGLMSMKSQYASIPATALHLKPITWFFQKGETFVTMFSVDGSVVAKEMLVPERDSLIAVQVLDDDN